MDDPFEQHLRQSARFLREGRGRCPESTILVQYARGELPEDKAAELASHVDRCGICDYKLEKFKVSGEGPLDNPSEAELDAMVGRLVERMAAAFAERIDRKRSFASGFRRHVLILMSLAYTVSLAVVLVLYRGPRKEQPRDNASEPATAPIAGSVQTVGPVELRQPGDAIRGTTRPGRDEVVVLSFFVPIVSGFHYSAEITDASGKLIAREDEIRSFDGIGNFYLVYSRVLLAKGRYTLKVTQSNPAADVGARRQFIFIFSA